jgi:E3 ubiquitin-protein ligase MYCBP2
VIQDKIKAKALERAKIEGLHKHPKFLDPGYEYHGNLAEYAMFKCSYYMCHKCGDPFFGGLKDCDAGQQEARDFKPEDLMCGKCSSKIIGAGVKSCAKHGTDYIDYKCKFCCSIALFFCWGTTHFCDACHRVAGRNKVKECKGKGKCDLGPGLDDHPPNGQEYALGCNVCRSEKYMNV